MVAQPEMVLRCVSEGCRPTGTGDARGPLSAGRFAQPRWSPLVGLHCAPGETRTPDLPIRRPIWSASPRPKLLVTPRLKFGRTWLHLPKVHSVAVNVAVKPRPLGHGASASERSDPPDVARSVGRKTFLHSGQESDDVPRARTPRSCSISDTRDRMWRPLLCQRKSTVCGTRSPTATHCGDRLKRSVRSWTAVVGDRRRGSKTYAMGQPLPRSLERDLLPGALVFYAVSAVRNGDEQPPRSWHRDHPRGVSVGFF